MNFTYSYVFLCGGVGDNILKMRMLQVKNILIPK